MRFISKAERGFRVYAVTGVNTVSFGISATANAKKGLLGFGVERADTREGERYRMPGFKVFRSVIPQPDDKTQVSTMDHPVQSFVWDDFTAKDGREYTYWFHPLRGEPKNLDRTAPPLSITVKTEKAFSSETHDVFFNRGVASSQAYTRKFGNQKPDKLTPPKKQVAARAWLSRDLDEAMIAFIDNARSGDTLLGCFYEFRYEPVAKKLKEAATRGVEVKLILDGKVNESTDKKGNFHPSFPREENKKLVKKMRFAAGVVTWREARPSDIQHNKFMVLLKGSSAKPKEVWSGSTNLSDGGIHGQTNVGHWVRDAGAAAHFVAYWNLLAADPGGKKRDDAAKVRKKNAELKEAVELLLKVPASTAEIPTGITPVFSPRSGLEVLKLYVDLLDTATDVACITLAFGINKEFKARLSNNSALNALTFALLEKEDRPNKKSKDPFIFIGARQNVYKAWGSFLREPLYQWAKETNAKALQLNQHVSYVHSKFLLRDPLGKNPIVVTGSANFSNASTNSNDENMLIIRGDQRVADIYFTEFNRIFNHYYFRSVVESAKRREGGSQETEASLFLKEKPAEWLVKYKPGTYRAKRLNAMTNLKGEQ